jgi:hypothetical protein
LSLLPPLAAAAGPAATALTATATTPATNTHLKRSILSLPAQSAAAAQPNRATRPRGDHDLHRVCHLWTGEPDVGPSQQEVAYDLSGVGRLLIRDVQGVRS